jgi:uncharacterized lipoprotein YmbA
MKRSMLWWLLAASLLLEGCMGGANTRLYSFPVVRDDEVSALGRTRGLLVVGPVNLAGEIDRPQLVVRRSASELEIRELDQWAGTLEDEVQKLMVGSLSKLLANERVVAFPWTGRDTIAYRLAIDVREMMATPGGEASLVMAGVLYNERSQTEVKWPPRTYRAAVPADAELADIVMIYRSLQLQAAEAFAQQLLPVMRR